jgi:aminopeptidase N
VLHMLRRLIGDEAFFRGVRKYYGDNRYRKAGTSDLRRAMEVESGISLERFFQRWIFESGIPRLRYSTVVEGQELVVRFDQVRASAEAPLYDVPVTVSIQYADKVVEEIVAVTGVTVEKRIPLTGAVRDIDVNADGAAIAVIDKR